MTPPIQSQPKHSIGTDVDWSMTPQPSEQGKVDPSFRNMGESAFSSSDPYQNCMLNYEFQTRDGAYHLYGTVYRMKSHNAEFRKEIGIPENQELTPEQWKAFHRLEQDTPYEIGYEIDKQAHCVRQVINETPLARGIESFIKFGFPPVESNKFMREALSYITLGVSDNFETLYEVLQAESVPTVFRPGVCQPDSSFIWGTGIHKLPCKDGLAIAAFRIVDEFVKRTNR